MGAEDITILIEALKTIGDPVVQSAWIQVLYGRAWDVLWVIVGLISITLWWKDLPKRLKRDADGDASFTSDASGSIVILWGLLNLCFLVVILFNVSAIINTIINPNWMIYTKILSLLP